MRIDGATSASARVFASVAARWVSRARRGMEQTVPSPSDEKEMNQCSTVTARANRR
jgi:hypothetical protein